MFPPPHHNSQHTAGPRCCPQNAGRKGGGQEAAGLQSTPRDSEALEMLWKSRIWKSRGRSAWQRVVTAPAQGQGQMVLLAPDTAKLQELEMLLVGWITPDLVSSLCAQKERGT